MLVSLHDGVRVLVRPVRADDVALLRRGLASCSAETLRSRFLSAKPAFSAAELRYLTDVDQRDHVALVAVRADRPEVMAGIGRWIRDPEDPSRAEVAFLVADAFHGLGLGTALGLALADAAVGRGVRTLTASVLAGNAASRSVLRAMAERMRTAHGGSVDELVLDLPDEARRAEAHAAEAVDRFHEQPTLQIRRPAGARAAGAGTRVRRTRGRPTPEDPDWARAA